MFFFPIFLFSHQTMAAASKSKSIDLVALRAALPPTDRSDDSKKKRAKIFKDFDPNSNGYLSFAEVDGGCRNILKLYAIFDCKPVIQSAYNAAKSANNTKVAKKGAKNVSHCWQ